MVAVFICVAAFSRPGLADEVASAPVKRSQQKVLCWLRAGTLMASVGGREVSLKDLKSGSPEIELGGVRFRKTLADSLEIVSETDVLAESPDFKGWSVELPQRTAIGFNLDIKNQRLGLRMPPQSNRSLVLRCDLGGKFELKAGAKGQIDFFDNGSYLFKGLGAIDALNSDGQKFDFHLPGSAMSDGPLVLQKPVGGTEYWERASPTISLRISGTPMEDLQIKSGKEVVYKTGDTNSVVSFESLGARIHFNEKSDGSLAWRVEKGDFRISIEGILGLIATADSGDAATMNWSKSRKLVDIKSLAPESFRIALPGRSYAIVEFPAEFQFSIAGPGMFSAAAAGGDVHLYNGEHQEISNLQAGSLMLDVKALRAGLTSGNGLLMHLTWDNGAPLEITADQVFAAIQPGSERIVKFGAEGIAKVSYGAGGFLTIEAVRSNFKLIVDSVHGIEIDLVEGDIVSLTLDLKKGTFTVKADERNVNDVAVTTESGYSPVLEAARALNFNIGKNGALLASSGGQPLYFASGTGDIPTKGLNPPPPYNQNDQTGGVPPIVQPPVSVSGAK